jgi:hypothetical protein
MRIVAHGNIVLERNVKPFEILADENQVDILEATAWHDCVRWAEIGIKLEFLTQTDVDGAEAAAHRGRQRSLQCQFGPMNTVQCGFRQRIPGGLDAGKAARLPISGERSTQSIQHLNHGFHDLRADTVSRDQGRGDFVDAASRACFDTHWSKHCQ